ncbi:Alpha/Beta hydrolase protein [Dichotomopilus funicola]|uniref:Alpha/Beta hydrolase protein n=1 Tax=Dichotomopilus funicola TaxID=1934379 RepID=A0AAN6V0U3_9PEZI|nr:Alpha/Beta hydrolase protein [Dichotomopilus funicola]
MVDNNARDLIEEHIFPKLDPDFLAYFSSLKTRSPTTSYAPIEHVRANPEATQSPCSLDASKYPGVKSSSFASEDGAHIPVQLYYPDSDTHGLGPYPVHLNFHGGGFVIGDLKTEATLCLSMREAGVVVVDVDYRLCPENAWGTGIQDAWNALSWVRESADTLNINARSISIGGVSAGGHISLVLQHMARDADVPLKLCMASVTPATKGLSYRYYTESPFSSFHEFYRGPVLPWARIKYFGCFCMPPEKLPELQKMWPGWWFEPLDAPNWSNLCDTFIRTAEVDPLRDEGEAYGMKLVAGGNKVTIKRYLGCPHTFMYISSMKRKQEYDRDAVEALRVAHGLA